MFDGDLETLFAHAQAMVSDDLSKKKKRKPHESRRCLFCIVENYAVTSRVFSEVQGFALKMRRTRSDVQPIVAPCFSWPFPRPSVVTQVYPLRSGSGAQYFFVWAANSRHGASHMTAEREPSEPRRRTTGRHPGDESADPGLEYTAAIRTHGTLRRCAPSRGLRSPPLVGHRCCCFCSAVESSSSVWQPPKTCPVRWRLRYFWQPQLRREKRKRYV